MRLFSSRLLRVRILAVCLTGGLVPAWPQEPLQESASPEVREAVLTQRLVEEPDNDALWRELDRLYDSEGWSEKRTAHLRAWIVRRPVLPEDGRPSDLAALLVQANRPGAAVAVLEAALSRGGAGNWRLAEQLAALHVLAGQPEKVDEVARRFQRSAPGADRALAYLLLARADLARYRPEDALAHYRDLFASDPVDDHGATEEYLALLQETGRAAEAVKFLERRWEVLTRAQAQPVRDRTEFTARQLSEAGFGEAALAYLERQYQALGSRPVELLILQGQLHLESGDAVSAIRVLREAREKSPDSGEADELLSEAYRVFARQPG
jgi:hypothetical protein